MAFTRRISLEQFLLEKKLLTKEALQKAIKDSHKKGLSLRKLLIENKLLQEKDLLDYYEKELNVARANLSQIQPDPNLITILPETFARKNMVVPIFKSANTLMVAMANPLDIIIIDEMRLKTGCNIEPMVASESEVNEGINHYYGLSTGSIEDVIKSIDDENIKIEGEKLAEEEEIDASRLANMAEEAPIVKLVNIIILQAIKDGASDIHIEPEEKIVKVRYRIDGILHDSGTIPKHMQAAVISRIKIMSDLNIAVKRAPQDGRFQIKLDRGPIDFRVSSFPTIYGENVVMRILDPTSIMIGLEQLGFSENNFKAIKSLIDKPHGIILVTGPTGSGKTTTLYSALNAINSPDKNIITVEDPVEYRLPGIRQSQINPKTGLTFAAGLRSILRQDPDIIMVGEIRDLETAEIAIQAALTGHLVFATLHTNDAPGALTRLTDMGVEPFLIASSVIAVLAQRLVRTICKNCKASYQPSEKELATLNLNGKNKINFQSGKGCDNCKKTGYRGRIGIYELMLVSEKIRELLMSRSASNIIKKTAQEEGMKTLREDGIDKISQGLTTIEEVVRVTMVD